MATKKYLDQTGLAEVAGYVNSRLKTVTTMPVTANDKAVRLYVGEDTASYLKGHIYQFVKSYGAWEDLTKVIPVWDSIEHQATAKDTGFVFFLASDMGSNYKPQQFYKTGYRYKNAPTTLRYYYYVSGEYYEYYTGTNNPFAEGDTIYIASYMSGGSYGYAPDILVKVPDEDYLVPSSLADNSDAYIPLGDSPSYEVDPVIRKGYFLDWVPLYDMDSKQDTIEFAMVDLPDAYDKHGNGVVIAKNTIADTYYIEGHTYASKTKTEENFYAWDSGEYYTTSLESTATPVYVKINDQMRQIGGFKRGNTFYLTNGAQVSATRYAAGDLTDEHVYYYEDITASGEDTEAREVAAGAMALAQQAYEAATYEEPQITSFTMNVDDTYEIGSTVNSITFDWAYNKDITSQTLTDCTLASASVRTATYDTPLSSNKTFTLTASDGKNSVSASKSVSFKHKVYWGAASEPSEFTSAFILALTGKKFATNYKGSYNMNLGEGQYGYLAYPASWGTVSAWWIGGFEVETYDCGTIEFTNASGNTTTFRITRTTQPSLGSITAEVK